MFIRIFFPNLLFFILFFRLRQQNNSFKYLAANFQASVDSEPELKKSPFFPVPTGMTCRDGNPGKLLVTTYSSLSYLSA